MAVTGEDESGRLSGLNVTGEEARCNDVVSGWATRMVLMARCKVV